jgi:hypothetical protein
MHNKRCPALALHLSSLVALTTPKTPFARKKAIQTAHQSRARLGSTSRAYFLRLVQEDRSTISKRHCQTYESQASWSFHSNEATRVNGVASSDGRHLSACYSAFAIALGRDVAGKLALHAGRRPRVISIFLRHTGSHHSRQAGGYLALVSADGIRTRWILWLRPD